MRSVTIYKMKVRGGGVILDLDRQVRTRFTWGLGQATNN